MLSNRLRQIAEAIDSEQDPHNVLEQLANLRAFLVGEEVIRRVVEGEPEAAKLDARQRFLFYTLESLVGDVWRQLNTDSLLFLNEEVIEENAEIARAMARAVLSVLDYKHALEAGIAQPALDNWANAVNVLLTVLSRVNDHSLRKWKSSEGEGVFQAPTISARGTFDTMSVRLAERALLTAFNPSAHVLSTAGLSSYFFDFDRFVLNSVNAPLIRKALVSQIQSIERNFGVDRLGILEKGGENTVGCLTMTDSLSSESGIPSVLVRLTRHLLVDRVKTAIGETVDGKRVLPITDNISNGAEIRSAVRALKKLGAVVTDVLVVLFRGSYLVQEQLEDDGVGRIHAILTPEILYFTAKSLSPRVQDPKLRDLLEAAVKEIGEKHLMAVRA